MNNLSTICGNKVQAEIGSAERRPSKHRHRYIQFQYLKVLGVGAYGRVELVEKDGAKYAMKIIEKKHLSKLFKEYTGLVEKEILTKMKHPGIVRLKMCFQDSKHLYYCFEHCEANIDLIRFFQINQQQVTPNLKVFYAAEIVSVIQYLQKIKVIHRDLKPQNILLGNDGHIRVIDFGTADVKECIILDEHFKQSIDKMVVESEISLLNSSQKKNPLKEHEQIGLEQSRRIGFNFVGTCYYMPPQILEGEGCGLASDLWALGCTLYQFYQFEPLFSGNQLEVFEKIKSMSFDLATSTNIPPQAIDLIQKLLRKNPNDRLGSNSREGLMFQDLKRHPYFASIQNFNTLFDNTPELLKQSFDIRTQPQLFENSMRKQCNFEAKTKTIQKKLSLSQNAQTSIAENEDDN